MDILSSVRHILSSDDRGWGVVRIQSTCCLVVCYAVLAVWPSGSSSHTRGCRRCPSTCLKWRAWHHGQARGLRGGGPSSFPHILAGNEQGRRAMVDRQAHEKIWRIQIQRLVGEQVPGEVGCYSMGRMFVACMDSGNRHLISWPRATAWPRERSI